MLLTFGDWICREFMDSLSPKYFFLDLERTRVGAGPRPVDPGW